MNYPAPAIAQRRGTCVYAAQQNKKRPLSGLTVAGARATTPAAGGNAVIPFVILKEGPISVAQRVVVTLSDDIDGGEAAETVSFGLDGKFYEIDLNTDNAKRLREDLAPFVEAGRKRTKSGKAYHRTSVEPDPRAVRAWAESNGMEVPARGRIPKKVYDAFKAAH